MHAPTCLPACLDSYHPPTFTTGLQALIGRHTTLLGGKDMVYGLINREGLADYGPSFQVGRQAWLGRWG